MITVTENMGIGAVQYTCAYSDQTFLCPMCSKIQDLYGGTVSFCLDCHADILDVSDLIDDEEYRIKVHFGIIGYDGEETE